MNLNWLLILIFVLPMSFAAQDTAMTPAAIAQRLAPVGKVYLQGEITPITTGQAVPHLAAAAGKTIYQTICSDCHASGEVRSPRFGDAKAWAPRIAKGLDVLYGHALSGFRFMPPKGTCDACLDEEIKAAVNYMVSKSKH